MFRISKPVTYSRLFRPLRAPATRALLIALMPFALAVGDAQAQGHSGMSMPMGSSQAEGEKPTGVGTVNAVKASERKVNLSHEPIPAIKWPSMTMDFPTASSVDLSQVKPGTKVQFTLSRGANGTYTIESIKPMP